MKILLIILCAFLLKAEASAQTWWNVSPQNISPLKKMQSVLDTVENFYILVYNDTLLYTLDNGTKWYSEPSYSEYCNSPDYPGYIRFYFSNIFTNGNDEIFKTLNGFSCGSTDASKILIQQSKISYFDPYPDSTYINDGGMLRDNIIGAYSKSNDTKYVLSKLGYTYLTPLSFKKFSPYIVEPLKIEGSFYNEFSDLLIIDTRTPTFYISTYKDTLTYINDSLYSTKLETLYKKTNQDSICEFVATVPVFRTQDNNTFKGGVYDIYFPLSDSNIIIIATGQGLWRYNDSSNQIDTLLKIPTRSIFFKENSDIAYAGTETGEIYRSTDAGETWSLFASGFSTKPVIGIYASGNDSLIVGTEDGVWANYALPVSVAEEIPFKNNELTITPNPANTSLKISFLKTDLPQQLSIYNSLGQLVFKTEFSGEFVWDFKNDIPDGIYTVAVQSGGMSVAKQVVIVK